jgi:tRNA threonylcarbamoyladenosine biosynthesis protein TsaB
VRVLALDTSGEAISVAALRDGAVVYESFERTGQKHSARLLTLIETALDAAGWTLDDVEHLAAVVGPGSYTGIRIGVSTARGIAQAAGIPCAAISSLETISMNAFGIGLGIVGAALDARAGQVYGAAFDCSGGMPVRMMEDTACSAEAFDRMFMELLCSNPPVSGFSRPALIIPQSITLNTDAVRDIHTDLIILPHTYSYPRAARAGMLAYHKPAISFAKLIPRYLRLSEAERAQAAREAVC